MVHLCLCCFLPAAHVNIHLEAILSSFRFYGPSLPVLRDMEREARNGLAPQSQPAIRLFFRADEVRDLKA